ncbi:MAG: DNA polymerase III subunit delta [Brevefilum sp.]
MTETTPVVYILRGDDREAIESHIHTFYSSLGTSDMAEMNITRLEGKGADMNDLRSAALAMPFLTERRLVVLEDALEIAEGGEQIQADFIDLLSKLPQTTALVLAVEDFQKNRKVGGVWKTYWTKLNQKHWLTRWVENAGNRAMIIDCPLPAVRNMVNWIRKKAADLGGAFTSHAAAVLADHVGNNTQRAAQEIVKLLTYVNYARPVDDDDVRRLTKQEHQSDIFDMVDAIGARDGQQAIELLHRILEDNELGPVFGMVIRQFRLLLQAREIMDEGGGDSDVAKTLGLHSFVARKISNQTRHFSLTELEAIYQLLHEIDVDMKTGGMDGETALDMLITRVSKRMI